MADSNGRFAFPDHKFQRMLTSAVLFQADWRQRNTGNFSYYDGEQWTKKEITTLQERGQQASVLNIIRPTVDRTLAMEVNRRTDLQVIGRNPDDGEMADMLTKLLKQVYDQVNFNYFQGRAFREGIIGGAGWIEVSVEEINGRNEIIPNWIPWDEVFSDPFFKKPDGTDARYHIRQVWMDRDQLIEEFPKKEDEITAEFSLLDQAITLDFKGQEQHAQSQGIGIDSIFDETHRRAAVNETWYKDKTGTVRHVIWMANVFLVGVDPDVEGMTDEMNESPFDANMYPLVPYFASRNRKGEPQGIVEFIRPIQDALNKAQSKYIWTISARQAVMEEGAIEDPEELRQELAKPDGIIKTAPGRMAGVQILEHFNESTMLMQNMQFLIGMAQRVSGINDATLGVGGVNARSAQQESTRLLQGAQMQTSILENLFFTRRQVAQVVLRLMGQFYNESRIIRVTQPNGFEATIELNKAERDEATNKPTGKILNKIDDLLRFDVVMKEVPPFDTVKQLTMQSVVEAGKAGVLPPDVAGKLIIQLSDIPDKNAILQELAISQERQQQLQLAAQQQEAQLRLA